MKNTLFSWISFFLLTNSSIAQIQITNADLPSVNDTIRYSTSATSVSNLINDTGANKVWNASNLIPNYQDIAQFKSALNASFGYALSFNGSSYGTPAPDLNFLLISATNVYEFYTKNATAYTGDGRGLTVSGLPLTQTNSRKDTIYRFPLFYGKIDSSSFVSNEVNLVVATLSSAGKRSNKADAWGSLTTPFGTFDCLRIKTVIQQTDSINLQGFKVPVANNRTEYKWIAKGQKIPILEISVPSGGIGGQTTVKYRDINRPEVFKGKSRFTANKTLFAVNSTDTCIITSNSTNTPKSYQWTISPSSYTYTGGTNATSERIKLFFTATGKYTITLKTIYNGGNSDSTKIDYISVEQGPTANFGSNLKGPTNTTTVVELYDSSTGTPPPTQWLWTFSPARVSFISGTSAISRNPKVTFDSAASYSVTLKVTNTVGSNSITKNNWVIAYPTSTKEVAENKAFAISIFPNPSTGYVHLLGNLREIEHIECHDIQGKKQSIKEGWQSQEACELDASSLPAGMYFLSFSFKNGPKQVQRITIEK